MNLILNLLSFLFGIFGAIRDALWQKRLAERDEKIASLGNDIKSDQDQIIALESTNAQVADQAAADAAKDTTPTEMVQYWSRK